MSGEGSRIAAPAARTPKLAFACMAVWVLAAGITRVLGAWVAIGGVAVGLGMAVLLLDRSGSVSLLRPSSRLVLLGLLVGGSMAFRDGRMGVDQILMAKPGAAHTLSPVRHW